LTLKENLVEDLKNAMRTNDEPQRSVIRLIRAAIQNEEISKGKSLDDTAIVEVVSRMASQYRDSISAYQSGNRTDLATREKLELDIVSKYLPPQLTRVELTNFAQRTIQELGITSPTDKGKVMGKLMPQLRGKADGNVVNEIVNELLSALTE
jgi:uncharacterized protein YqeY